MTILNKIKENAEKIPNRAVFIQSSPEGIDSIDWRTLDDSSDRLAYWLDQHLKTKTPIIVYGHKHPMMIVCFLACVKSGRAYCPIDRNVPLSRIEAIIKEVDPEMILTTEKLDLGTKTAVGLEDLNEIIKNETGVISEDSFVKENDVFYIIFTSGSTGVPKGVQITRGCLDNFIQWAIGLGSGNAAEKPCTILNQAPFAFDLSVMDLYLCLYTGGTLWALTKDVQNDMKLLYKSLHDSEAAVWVSTPSFAEVCLSDPCFCDALMPSMKDFLFCGEILTNRTVSRLAERFPNAQIINTYGPTESTCAVTSVKITPAINETNVPLPVGEPKPGTSVRIINENKEVLTDGEKGEIVIVGNTVGAGYWNNPEKTEQSFGVIEQDGVKQRYYKTGDEGYLERGMLYYSGRIDLQVKLHGYRIELGDIESNLLAIAGVEQAVVIPKYRDGKVSSLVAGVVLAEGPTDEKSAAAMIKQNLRDTIPEYMIPKRIRFLSSVPMTNNGKVDRRALEGIL